MVISVPPVPPRRVVTGLSEDGRSDIVFDGPAPTVIWSTDRMPVDNSGTVDTGGPDFAFPRASQSNFIWVDFQPGGAATGFPMHASDTIDYAAILSGEVVLVMEHREITLRAGDVLVDRGVLHAWRNDSDAPCRAVFMFLPADPVGAGATS